MYRVAKTNWTIWEFCRITAGAWREYQLFRCYRKQGRIGRGVRGVSGYFRIFPAWSAANRLFRKNVTFWHLPDFSLSLSTSIYILSYQKERSRHSTPQTAYVTWRTENQCTARPYLLSVKTLLFENIIINPALLVVLWRRGASRTLQWFKWKVKQLVY